MQAGWSSLAAAAGTETEMLLVRDRSLWGRFEVRTGPASIYPFETARKAKAAGVVLQPQVLDH